MTENTFLDIKGVCNYLHLSKSKIYKMVSNNEIPHIKLGTRTLFDIRQIEIWVLNGGRMPDTELPQLPKLLKKT